MKITPYHSRPNLSGSVAVFQNMIRSFNPPTSFAIRILRYTPPYTHLITQNSILSNEPDKVNNFIQNFQLPNLAPIISNTHSLLSFFKNLQISISYIKLHVTTLNPRGSISCNSVNGEGCTNNFNHTIIVKQGRDFRKITFPHLVKQITDSKIKKKVFQVTKFFLETHVSTLPVHPYRGVFTIPDCPFNSLFQDTTAFHDAFPYMGYSFSFFPQSRIRRYFIFMFQHFHP